MKHLNDVDHEFVTPDEKEIVESIKEKVCYVALNFEEKLKCIEPFDYELPDGANVIIKDQRIRCPELAIILFKNVILIKEKIYIIILYYLVVIRCLMACQKD